MKRKIVTFLLIISFVTMLVSGGTLLYTYGQDCYARLYWAQISKRKQTATPLTVEDVLPEYRDLYNSNTDMVGWLQIDGTKIDYPVMQTKENAEYYLRKNFDREEDSHGTPFVDYRCDVVPEQSFNTIIYGHYTSGDSMFRWLLNYSTKSWYEEHSHIDFDTIDENGRYAVVAAFYYDATDSVLKENFDASDEECYEFYNYIDVDSSQGFKKFVNRINSLKLYDTGNKIKIADHIITLICCAPEAYSGIKENGRFVLIARKM